MITQVIKNRYEIVNFLGKGGFGETYLAKDLDFPNHPLRVVKILRPQTNDPQLLQLARDLFKREAEVLSKLGKHNLIPELFAYFEDNNEFFLVQEWIDGDDLTKEIDHGQKFSEQEVIMLLKDILTPLEIVHQNKVIHRDLKPSNLIRRRHDGKICLIDFGGVKQILTTQQNSPQKTIAIGTPGYFSMEQSQGFPVLASDIYSVGIIAIEALTGQFPISNDWEKQVKISSNFLNILNKMINPDLNLRYSCATEALTAINSLNNISNLSKINTRIITILSKPPINWLWKVSIGFVAIAVFIFVLSVKFELKGFNFNSPDQKQTPPPNWTW